MWSELHRLHVSILNVDPYTHYEHRKELISHKIVARGKWLVCTLCEKKVQSYIAAIPHIDSEGHKKKLAWLLAVDARNKAYSTGETSSLQSVVPRIEEPSEQRLILSAAETLQNVRASIMSNIGKLGPRQKGGQIIETCDLINRYLRDIQNAYGVTSTDTRQPDGVCVICLEKPSNHVLLPCEHQALCTECCTAYQERTCPVCRQIIEKSFRPKIP